MRFPSRIFLLMSLILSAHRLLACDRSVDVNAPQAATMSYLEGMKEKDQRTANAVRDAYKTTTELQRLSVMSQGVLRLYVTRPYYEKVIKDQIDGRQFLIDAIRLFAKLTSEKLLTVNVYVTGAEFRVAYAESNDVGDIRIRLMP